MDPFCAFCLRTNPANVDFFKHVVGSTVELRQSFQSMLGYNFPLENFSICNPCWKLMQLVQDFRTRCFKANSLVERIGQGLSSEDDWFSAKNLATIESVRMVIKDQMQQIGRVDVTWDEFRATDHDMNLEQKEDLVSTIDVGEVKIEAETEAGRDSSEEVSSYSSNENEPLSEQISLDVQNCNKCNRLFVNERALRVHLQKCTGKSVAGRLKTCHICSASFVLKSQLHAHLNIHEGKYTRLRSSYYIDTNYFVWKFQEKHHINATAAKKHSCVPRHAPNTSKNASNKSRAVRYARKRYPTINNLWTTTEGFTRGNSGTSVPSVSCASRRNSRANNTNADAIRNVSPNTSVRSAESDFPAKRTSSTTSSITG